MKNILKITAVFVVTFLLLTTVTGCNKNTKNEKLTINSTSFPGYDFARAIVGDNEKIKVEMLLKPGEESHTYEPTPKDIINIKNSDIFIYVGGDSDEWIEDILNDIDPNQTKIIKLIDLVNTKEEELIEGMEEEEEEEEETEIDEHVWTSPINAISIIEKLKENIIKIDLKDKEEFDKNADNYIAELQKIDTEIREVVNTSKRKEILFGDRFPLRYFVDEYGLTYYAAFPGCSDQTEASAKTVSFLIDKVRNDKIPVVFHIELSKSKIADTIAEETNTKVLEFHSAHNITQSDFDAGVTYIDIMKKNINALKEALS